MAEIPAAQLSEAARLVLRHASPAEAVPKSSAMALFSVANAEKRLVSIEIAFLRAPEPNRVPLFFDLPHEVHGSSTICLITPAPQRQFKEELEGSQSEHAVAKVVDVDKLQAKYSNPVARRALAKAFGAFFIHSSLKEFPKLLTGEFLTRHTPIWMDSKKGDLASRVARAKCRVACPRRGFDNVSIGIGHAGMSCEQLEENVQVCIDQLTSKLDNGWSDILSVRLAVSNGDGQRIALPVFAHFFAGLPTEEASTRPGAKRAR
mmetsp:Transcript_41255/g.127397  ORF Transcript_41255/g.127397 Transcript_41255/m.127397 type:complete len:262 (-) Transcript_41255:41-826(-)